MCSSTEIASHVKFFGEGFKYIDSKSRQDSIQRRAKYASYVKKGIMLPYSYMLLFPNICYIVFQSSLLTEFNPD